MSKLDTEKMLPDKPLQDGDKVSTVKKYVNKDMFILNWLLHESIDHRKVTIDSDVNWDNLKDYSSYYFVSLDGPNAPSENQLGSHEGVVICLSAGTGSHFQLVFTKTGACFRDVNNSWFYIGHGLPMNIDSSKLIDQEILKTVLSNYDTQDQIKKIINSIYSYIIKYYCSISKANKIFNNLTKYIQQNYCTKPQESKDINNTQNYVKNNYYNKSQIDSTNSTQEKVNHNFDTSITSLASKIPNTSVSNSNYQSYILTNSSYSMNANFANSASASYNVLGDVKNSGIEPESTVSQANSLAQLNYNNTSVLASYVFDATHWGSVSVNYPQYGGTDFGTQYGYVYKNKSLEPLQNDSPNTSIVRFGAKIVPNPTGNGYVAADIGSGTAPATAGSYTTNFPADQVKIYSIPDQYSSTSDESQQESATAKNFSIASSEIDAGQAEQYRISNPPYVVWENHTTWNNGNTFWTGFQHITNPNEFDIGEVPTHGKDSDGNDIQYPVYIVAPNNQNFTYFKLYAPSSTGRDVNAGRLGEPLKEQVESNAVKLDSLEAKGNNTNHYTLSNYSYNDITSQVDSSSLTFDQKSGKANALGSIYANTSNIAILVNAFNKKNDISSSKNEENTEDYQFLKKQWATLSQSTASNHTEDSNSIRQILNAKIPSILSKLNSNHTEDSNNIRQISDTTIPSATSKLSSNQKNFATATNKTLSDISNRLNTVASTPHNIYQSVSSESLTLSSAYTASLDPVTNSGIPLSNTIYSDPNSLVSSNASDIGNAFTNIQSLSTANGTYYSLANSYTDSTSETILDTLNEKINTISTKVNGKTNHSSDSSLQNGLTINTSSGTVLKHAYLFCLDPNSNDIIGLFLVENTDDSADAPLTTKNTTNLMPLSNSGYSFPLSFTGKYDIQWSFEDTTPFASFDPSNLIQTCICFPLDSQEKAGKEVASHTTIMTSAIASIADSVAKSDIANSMNK